MPASNDPKEDRFGYLVRKVFGTEEGHELMDELEAMYCRDLAHENPFTMAARVGQSDLVMQLKDIRDEQ